MSQEEEQESQDELQADRKSARGFLKTAWIAIAILVFASMFLQGRRDKDVRHESVNAVQQKVLDIQGQYLVAASQLPGPQKGQLYESADTLRTGPLSMRLRHIVLAGELVGPDEAIQQADAVQKHMAEQGTPISEREQAVVGVLRTLYSDYQQGRWDAPSLESSDRQLLRNDLGWFGALALSPEQSGAEGTESTGTHPAREEVLNSAWHTFVVVIVATLFAMGVGIAGLAGAFVFAILVVTRKIRSAIVTGFGDSAIYAETFAVWMLLLFVLSAVAALIARRYPNSQILLSSMASLLSLAALLWPTIRGIPWSQVRRDIGLFPGEKPIREVIWGAVCYVSNIPLLMVGLLATFALMGLYSAIAGGPAGLEPMEAPTHPVVQWVRDAGWIGRVQIYVLACLVAPLVEETVFRGVLYRHLRESTCRWSTGVSIALSAGFTSLIFAMIHPQGLMAIPALMAVATGLSLAREWRGSLLAPMAMHSANNGVLILLLFSLV